MTPNRDYDGRYSARAAAPPMPLAEGLAHYNRYLAAVCLYQGLDPLWVQQQLARYVKNTFDQDWRRAAYARHLAVYLANTLHNVPQTLLADITGQSRAAISWAVRQIEDLSDHPTYSLLIEKVTLAVKADLTREQA